MSEKPHKGRIRNWFKLPIGDDYIVCGRFMDHPEFASYNGHTSKVLHFDEATGEIETRNSRYTLIEPFDMNAKNAHEQYEIIIRENR